MVGGDERDLRRSVARVGRKPAVRVDERLVEDERERLAKREAEGRGVAYRLAKIPMGSVLRARTLSETRGFMKALVVADGDRVLGFTAFGAEASELMAVAQTAMLGGMPYTALRDAIFTHPTAAEGLIGLFANPPAAQA